MLRHKTTVHSKDERVESDVETDMSEEETGPESAEETESKGRETSDMHDQWEVVIQKAYEKCYKTNQTLGLILYETLRETYCAHDCRGRDHLKWSH